MTLSNEGQRILDAAREAYGPSGTDRLRVRRQLLRRLVGMAAVTTGGKAAASVSTIFASKAATLGIVASLAIGTTVSVGLWQRHRFAETSSAAKVESSNQARPTVTMTERPLELRSAPPAASNAEATTSAETANMRTTGADSRVGNSQSARVPASNPDVQGEIKLLSEAQRALSSGQPARALALLDQHARAFPHGTLVEERKAAHVIALCKLGQITAARAEAEKFIKNSPQSPLSERMRSTCGDAIMPQELK